MTVTEFINQLTLEQVGLVLGFIGTLLLAFVIKVNPNAKQNIDGDDRPYYFALVRSSKMSTLGIILIAVSFFLVFIDSLI